MVASRGHQIVQAGFTPGRPMHDVMRIDVSGHTATGEAAGTVPQRKGAANTGRHGAGTATDIEYLAALIFQHCDTAGVEGLNRL